MKFNQAQMKLKGVPFITENNARYLYNLILNNTIENILELGIAHGTATSYMAAALHELGRGHIISVDLQDNKEKFIPSAEEQLESLGLSEFVTIKRYKTGYTWFLHDAIKEAVRENMCLPKFDLCIIDGPKNWTIDGAAFFMADKLLCEGAFLIFDDYDWTYAMVGASRTVTDGITHRELSDIERRTPHIREVFDLLVRQHPNYSNFTVINNKWAIAQKITSDQKETVYLSRYEKNYKDIGSLVVGKGIDAARKIKSVLFRTR